MNSSLPWLHAIFQYVSRNKEQDDVDEQITDQNVHRTVDQAARGHDSVDPRDVECSSAKSFPKGVYQC